MTTAVFYHSADLPWTTTTDEKKRFQRILITVCIVTLLLSIIIPYLPTPAEDSQQAVVIPPRYARMLLTHKKPPPAAPKPVIREKPKPEEKIKKKPPSNKKVVPRKAEKVKPKPAKQRRAAAREKAKRSGLLALSSELSALRNNAAVASVRRQTLKKSTRGTTKKVQRAIISQRAKKGSQGIDTHQLSRNTGNTQLTNKHQSQQIDSPLQALPAPSPGTTANRDALPRRSDAEIQLVFDRYKGKLYTLYNRALRRDATLRGKVVLDLTIAPSGKVSSCKVISSELHNPKLERRLVTRIRMFDFGAQQVAVTRVTYPIDFFPG